jgi:hypothetical protein
MTAPIVSQVDRIPFGRFLTEFPTPMRGSLVVTLPRVPGSLWERVAEGKTR